MHGLRSIFPPLGRWLPWDSRRAASWPRISCSGWLAPGPVSGDAELAALKPPVFYGHGAADDIFPKADVTAMGEFWHEHGTLTEQVYPGMAHSINMPEMRDIQRFLETNGFIRPQIW